MSASKVIVLVRHGQTTWTSRRQFIGRTDVPIDAEGRRQAKGLIPCIRRMKPGRFFCSPLRRARETARIIGDDIGLDAELDQDICEIDFGRWEGMSFEDIASSDPDLVGRWAVWEKDFSFPEGESLIAFLGRVKRSADRMVADPASTILVVTHGGVIRALICHLLGLSENQYLLFDVGPASLTTIEVFDGKGVLTGLNNNPYLEGRQDGPHNFDHRR